MFLGSRDRALRSARLGGARADAACRDDLLTPSSKQLCFAVDGELPQPPMRRRYQRRCSRRCSRVSRRSRSSRTASSTARSAATCAGIERSGSSSASSRSMWRVRTCSAVWIETSGAGSCAGSRAAPCPGSCAAHDGGAARCRSTYSIGTTMRTSLSLPVILCQRFRRTRLRTDGTPVPSTAANSA